MKARRRVFVKSVRVYIGFFWGVGLRAASTPTVCRIMALGLFLRVWGLLFDLLLGSR